MKKVLRGWKRYLCFYLTMVMLTTSLGGCLFDKEQQPEQVTGSQVESESGNSVEKPTGGNTEESGQEATEESDQESKPSEEESKPSEEESKSSEEQSKPSEEQNKPSREENKPSQEESKPSQEQSKPSEESGAPSQEPSKPSEVPSKPADTTAPTAEIQIGTNKWNKFWNTVTFGIFCKDTKQVTITAADNVTAKPTIKYYLSDKELTEAEAKADGIIWTAYESAFDISPNSKQIVYAKVTDEAGNLVIVNSEGIVVYTDTVASVTDITYVKNVSGDVTVDVTLNGNTVAEIKNGTDILTSGTDYTVDAEGTICLKEAYLKTLAVGAYTLTVSYNPMGEVYQSESGNDEPAVTVMTLTVREPKLVSIKQPGAITGVENGTDKTAAALGLPETVTIVTEDTSVTTAAVTWDLTELAEGSYDPSVQKEQTFSVKGTVELPEGISNANNVNREVTIQVTVSAVVVDDTESYTVSLYHADTCLKTATKQAGTNLADISAPYVDGSIFLGWYYDKGQTQKVDPEDVLVKDVALYGKYGESVPLPESGSPNYLGETDVAPDFEIFVNANSTTASASDVREALKLSNLTAPSRTDESDAFEKDELIVTALGGGRFSVKAKDGYQEGATYELAIAGSAKVPGLVFEGQTTDVVYYNFTVKKEEVMNLSLDGDVIYLSVSELSKEDAEKILAYSGLYQAVLDPETNETSYQPTNTFGTFTYSEREFVAGDIIAVYEGTRPDLRGLDSSLNEGIAYIEITKAEGSNYEYKSADSSDVLFTPDIIPIDIDENDGVTGWTEAGTSFTIVSSLLDFTTGYEKVNLDFETVVEPGDFVAFYTGDFGAENAAVKGYGKIISVTETGTFTEIHYSVATESEVLASMDIFNESDLSDEQLDSIDDQMLVASIKDQVLESGFAQEAGMYLASMAVETDEVKELLGDTNLEFKDCIITYSDGTPVPTDEMMLMANVLTGGGNGTPEISVNISKGLSHFSSGKGFQVELALKYGFDLKKSGSNSKIHIEMTAIFQTEVMIKFSASGGAVWKTAWIFPYIADYEMSGNIDQGLYTNIAITATAQLEENEFEGPDQMLQPEDTTSGNSNAQQIIDLSESIRNMMEECKQQSSENEGSGFDGLTDKYQRFIEQASDNWVELVCVPLFSSEGTLDPFYITAYSVSIDFVISATMSVSIGMSFQYEKCQRHSFTLLLFHTRDSSSKTVDISPERYQFDFYVMGTLGVRAGIRAKVMFGVFSVKLAGIGIKLEAGAYARLWGYFYYCLSWEKGKGKESSSMGALYIEIGVYLKINLALEVLNGTFSYCPTLYEGEWPIWSAGTQKHVMSYQYDDTGYFHGSIPGAGDDHYIPLSYDMLREKTIVVPAEVFRMYYMDLKNGATNHALYDSVKRCSSDKTSSAYDDEENFFVEISEPFSYDPTTNTISVNPEEGRYSYEGTVTFTWKQQDITFNTKPITRTFDVSWVDPDHGYLLAFDTKGGTLIRTKVYDAGKEVEAVEDPTKIGYAFAGWYSDEEYTKSATVPTIMPEGNVTLYAKWVPVPNQYYVRHAYESLYDGYIFENEVIQKDIYTDDPAKTMRVYTDDVLDQERIIADNRIDRYGFEIDYEKTTKSCKVAPDGSTVVAIYYKRLIHDVTYTMGELKDEQNPDVVYHYRYEEPIYAPYLYMLGYQFKGWNTAIAETMDTSDLSYHAVWEGNPNTPYYLEYYVENPETGQYIMLGGQNGRLYKEGTTGASVAVGDYLLEDVGYQFEKVTINGVESDLSGVGKINPKGNLTIRYYYKGISYPLTFDAGLGVINGQKPVEYIHGIPLSIVDVTAVRTGYQFLGWFEAEDAEEAIDTIPSSRVGDIHLTAGWKANTYTLHLFDESTSLGTVTATYDEILPSLEQIPEKAGYVFDGYYTAQGEQYYDSKGNGKIIWEQLAEINLKAKWTPKEVEITFDTNGGEELIPIGGTYLGKYPTLPVPVREGYEFVGWSLDGVSIQSNDTIQSYNDHTLAAGWNPVGGTPYTVECYIPDEEGNGYQKYDSFTLTGMTDSAVTVGEETYRIPGYLFDAAAEGNVLSDTLKADGSTVLKMYYRAGNKYQVTFNYGYEIPSATEFVVMNEGVALPWGLPEGTSGPKHQSLVGWKLGEVFYDMGAYYNGIMSDLEFTAVWEKQPFRVYYRYYDSETRFEDFISQDLDMEVANQVLDNLYTKAPEYDEQNNIIGYYEFAGWNTEYDGTGTTYQPGADLNAIIEAAVSEGISELDLYVQWNLIEAADDLVKYDVIHRINSVNNYPKEYTVACYGKVGEQTKASAYRFADTTVLTDNIEQQQLTKDTEIAITISYQWNTYSLKLDYAGGSYDGKTGIEADGLEVETNVYAGLGNVDVNSIIPAKSGYEFAGWDVKIPDYMPAHDIVATAQYKETGTYPVTVKYLTENLDGSGYTEVESETVYAMPGEFTPTLRTYNGFVTPEAQTVTVTEAGAECTYRYERATYTLTWDAGEGSIISDEGTYSSGQIKYGTPITAPGVSLAGYTGSFKNFTGTMPAQDITYKAVWTPQKVAYHVMYRYRKNDTDPTFTTLCSQRFEALAGSVVEASSEIPASQTEAREKVANGYVKPLSRAEKIAGDGSTIIIYDYELAKYHLSYDFSGGSATTTSYAPSGDYACGKLLQIPLLTQVEKTGYTPIGWYDTGDPDQKIVEGQFIEMSSRDVTYKLKWKPVTFTITYDLALEGAENPFNPGQYQIGFDFNISGAFCEHYAFKGWEWNGEGSIPEGVEIMENGLVHVTDEAEGNLSFKATWDPHMKQFVARLYEGASEVYIYNYPETVKLRIQDVVPPTREGYIFDYWTKKVPGSKSGYTTVQIGGSNYVENYNVNTDFTTAKWLAVSEMGDGYYAIHVTDFNEFKDALRIMKEQTQFRGIKLEQDIQTNILYEALWDVWEEGYVLDGQGHSIKYGGGGCFASLFRENYGTIMNLSIYGGIRHSVKGEDAADTYAGMLAEKNYGLITKCYTGGTASISSDARYVGGLVGYNEGTISGCSLDRFNVTWRSADSSEKGNTVGYVGGYAGYNAYNGVIKNCSFDALLGNGCSADQEVFVGGIAGINQGLISECTVKGYVGAGASDDQDTTPSLLKAYAGGIAGIDAAYDESDPDKAVRGIYNCIVQDCLIKGSYAAGGLMGECNYSALEGNELVGVEVYTNRGYAGQIAGVYDSMRGNITEYNYITNAKIRTNTGQVGVVAAYGREWGQSTAFNGLHYPMAVRSRDDKTRVVINGEYTYYKKGAFYPYWHANKYKFNYYSESEIVSEEW